jgi:hypothetical protein
VGVATAASSSVSSTPTTGKKVVVATSPLTPASSTPTTIEREQQKQQLHLLQHQNLQKLGIE